MSGPVDASDRVCVGVIGAPHGVRGLVRLKSFTAEPEAAAAYGPLCDESGREFRLTVTGRAKEMLVCRVDGVGDRAAAEALKGVALYLPRAALPPAADPDEFYHADLIGLAAVTADGTEIGRVAAVYDFGGGDLLEVAPAAGGSPLVLPFTREAVPEVDLVSGRVVIAPPPGLWEPAAGETAESGPVRAGRRR